MKKKANSNRMIARRSSLKGRDDFPTPPWATRALTQVVLPHIGVDLRNQKVLEPACGRGHMVRTLEETGAKVRGSDLHDYGQGFALRNFTIGALAHPCNWVITNPPYKHAHIFFSRASMCSLFGCALLMRLNWLQGEMRYSTVFHTMPPRIVAVFSGRIPARKGRVVKSASVFFQHCWVVWQWSTRKRETELFWIPPNAQELFEKDEDYE